MIETRLINNRLDITLDNEHTDLRLAFGPQGVCFAEPGEGERCLLLDAVETIHIDVEAPDGLVEIANKLSDAQLPALEFGEINDQVTIYGDITNVEVPPSELSVLRVPGCEPEEIRAHEQQITQFHADHRPPKSPYAKIKAAILRFVGRDSKLGVRSFGEAVSLAAEIFEGKGIRRIVAEYLARRHHSEIQRSTVKKLEGVLQSGDILLRYQNGYPLDKYVVGVWQHAGACVDDHATVMDSLSEGVAERPLTRFAHADAVVILRPHLTEQQHKEFLDYLHLQAGKGYNFDFSPNENEHYCSGLVYHALEHCGFAPHRKDTVHPDELLRMPGMDVVWTNRMDLVAAALTKSRRR